MGRYWTPVNLTKREFFDPTAVELASGALSMLLCQDGDKRYNGIISNMGRWAGDTIAMVGDEGTKDYTDISQIVVTMFQRALRFVYDS
jgi:6-phosphofructokinase